MLKITDTVKVIAKTNCGGIKKELIPVGTICIIVSEHKDKDGSIYYGVTPLHNRNDLFYYLESELEKVLCSGLKKANLRLDQKKTDMSYGSLQNLLPARNFWMKLRKLIIFLINSGKFSWMLLWKQIMAAMKWRKEF